MSVSKKSTSKRSDIKPGDVLLYRDHMVEVFCIQSDGLVEVLPVDKESMHIMTASEINSPFVKNLGKSDSVIAAFYAARSIHLRLNRINP